MRPETWMREGKFTKVRKRLAFWTREDFVNLARHLFGTEDLDLKELDTYCTELKKPGIQPPGGLVARDPIVVPRRNPENYTGTGKSRVYLSKKGIRIQFADLPTQFDWAYRLMVATGLPWEKAKAKWAEGMRLEYFHEIWHEHRNLPGLMGLKPDSYELDPQLVKVLERLTKQWERLTTPYPDRTPLRRQYNSLSRGDQLLDEGGNLWEVSEVKAHLDSPPEITLERKEAANVLCSL